MDIHLEPKLLTGRLVRITDVHAVIELKGRMGMLHLPLRSIIADTKLQEGDEAEIWISYAKITHTTNEKEDLCN